MNHLKQLDDILKFIKDGDILLVSGLDINAEFKDVLEVYRGLILDKLQKDGYIEKTEGAFPNYWITYNGLIFLSYKGYTGQNKRTRRKYRRQFIVDIALIFGGTGAFIAGIYTLWEIYKGYSSFVE